jgi:hypothetical protein
MGIDFSMYKHRFLNLLVVLFLLFLTTPLVRLFGTGSIFAGIVLDVVFAGMMLAAIFAVSRQPRTVVVAIILAALTFALQAADYIFVGESLEIARYILTIAFLGFTVIVILKHLFVSQCVTTDVVCASLCVYLLLAVIWAMAYPLIEIVHPGSFIFGFGDIQDPGFMRFNTERSIFCLYYSLVTMSTLGYGDIVPVASAARMLAAVQAVTGQLYLAVLVARLVGLHIAHSAPLASKDAQPIP